MRSSVLVLPLLLLVSPGDGTSARRSAPVPLSEAWNPLRPWQQLARDSVAPNRSRVAGARKLPTCPMPVTPVPAVARPVLPVVPDSPPGSFRAFWDTLHESRPAMPIARSGCSNPLFTKDSG